VAPRDERSLAAVQSAILDGDGAYYRGSVSLVSRAIQVGGRGRYSHVGTFLWLDGVLCIHEFREFLGCRLVLAEREVRARPGQIDWYATAAPDYALRAAVRRRALEKLGKRYDWGGVLRAARYHTPGLRWTVWPDDDDAALAGPDDPEHCSSCRADLWAVAGLDLVPNLANRTTEPSDLARSALEKYRCTLV
jgi:hypothetical protein